jgi:hypothetical protein
MYVMSHMRRFDHVGITVDHAASQRELPGAIATVTVARRLLQAFGG